MSMVVPRRPSEKSKLLEDPTIGSASDLTSQVVLNNKSDNVIKVSVKLCGRYIPPPRPRVSRETVKASKVQSTISYEWDESSDECDFAD